jgi:hypothetical protein
MKNIVVKLGDIFRIRYIKIMMYAATSHNRPVYASPPYGSSDCGLPRSIATLIPTANLRHILSALDFA